MSLDDEDSDLEDLHIAVLEDNVARFRTLVNDNPEAITSADWACHFIVLASRKDAFGILNYLVEEAGVHPDTTEPNWFTPLQTAVREGRTEVVHWLLDHGAALNIKVDGIPDCPILKWAVDVDKLDMVQLLVERGADVNAVGRDGKNAYMYAFSPEVKDYLRSVGGVDVQVATPPNYDESHRQILLFMQEYAEEEGHWGKLLKWNMQFPGAPPITLRACGPGPGRNSQLLFTVGMSDVVLQDEVRKDGYGVELMMSLPTKWKLTARANANPKWNWPMTLLEKLARRIIANGRLNILWSESKQGRTYAITETLTDSVEPLVPGTRLCGWLLLDCGYRNMPDTRTVQFLFAIPVYPEELEFVRERADYEALVRRFSALNIPRETQLDRPNAVTDWPEDWPDLDEESCGV